MSESINYLVRNIPLNINQRLDDMLEIKTGQASQRVSWLRALVYIGVLDVEISVVVFEIYQRALQIAKRQRGNDELRAPKLIYQKLAEEQQQFSETLAAYQQGQCDYLAVVNRLANIVYYTVQRYAQDGDLAAFDATLSLYAGLADVQEGVALQCARAKYGDRAQRERKDVDAEIEAMNAVLQHARKS